MRRRTSETLQPGRRIRVLVVDDSVVIRQLVTHAIAPDPLLEIVGVAANGSIALSKIPQVNPDVLTLDIEMPEMDGLETLRRVRKEFPNLRIVMFSTLTERGASITLDALSLGADDYVAKVSNEGSLDRSLTRLRGELIPKIKQFFSVPGDSGSNPMRSPSAAAFAPASARTPDSTTTSNSGAAQTSESPTKALGSSPARRTGIDAVCIGVSTGGPNALGELLPTIAADFPLPILLVQHMPPLFTRLLAERLNSTCKLEVREATNGEVVTPGKILIAPGGFHMRAHGQPGKCFIRLDQSPPLNSCRPAVDALFESMTEVYGGNVLTVMLTGMGTDGLKGTELLKARGACSIAQDQETSVVWGMPGAVVQAGLADQILPLNEIGAAIQIHCQRNPARLQPATEGLLRVKNASH